jgi:hypothetical protein
MAIQRSKLVRFICLPLAPFPYLCGGGQLPPGPGGLLGWLGDSQSAIAGEKINHKSETKEEEENRKSCMLVESVGKCEALTGGIGSGDGDCADGHQSSQPEAEKGEKLSCSGSQSHGLGCACSQTETLLQSELV